MKEARTSTAYLTVSRVTKDDFGGEKETELATLIIQLHSDLVPLGTQNFAALLHRPVGGYRGTTIRLRGDGVLEGGDISESGSDDRKADRGPTWGTTYEPYFRWPKNQQHFSHNKRGLVSLVDCRREHFGGEKLAWNKFIVTLGEAPKLDSANLVFGSLDLFDPSTSEALEILETELKNGSIVRITNCGLASFQLKDLLDVSRNLGIPNDINWNAIRSKLNLMGEHPSYASGARWIVGNNGQDENERSILHGVLYHNAPNDIVVDAMSFVSEDDLVTADPHCDLCPLTVAYKNSVDQSTVQLIIQKVEASKDIDIADVYENVLKNDLLPNLGMEDLRLFLSRTSCDRELALQALECAVEGWTVVPKEDDSLKTVWISGDDRWRNEDERTIIDSVDELTTVWQKMELLLFAIERGDVQDFDSNVDEISPLATLLSLGIMRPRDEKDGPSLCSDDPLLPLNGDDYGGFFAFSVLQIVKFVGENFPHLLCRPNNEGSLPLHRAALSNISNYEREEWTYEIANNCDGVSVRSGYDLTHGEKILKYLLEKCPDAVLSENRNGDNVLQCLLSFKYIRPLVRIQLVLEACPKVALVMSRSGRMPLEDAMSLPEELEHMALAREQIYINNCIILALEKMSSSVEMDAKVLVERLFDSLSTETEYSCGICDLAAVIRHFVYIWKASKNNERPGAESLTNTVIDRILKLIDEPFESEIQDHYDEVIAAFTELLDMMLARCPPEMPVLDEKGYTPIFFLTENAFVGEDGSEYEQRMSAARKCWMQGILKVVLDSRPVDAGIFCQGEAPVLTFMKHAIPYFKNRILEAEKNFQEIKKGEFQRCTESEAEEDMRDKIASARKEAEAYLTRYLAAFPDGLNKCDSAGGRTLLHAALELGSDSDGIAKFLLRDHAHLAVTISSSGKLPLQIALENGCNVTADIFAAAPECIIQRDRASLLFPFQTAACSEKTSLDLVYHLLRQAPYLVAAGQPPTLRL